MRPLSTPCGKQGVKATPLEVKGAQQMTCPCVVCCKRLGGGGGGGGGRRKSREVQSCFR